jgi:hypothetical protein
MIFSRILEMDGSRLIGLYEEGNFVGLPGLWISIIIECFHVYDMYDNLSIELKNIGELYNSFFR